MMDSSDSKRKGSPATVVACPIIYGSSAVHLGKKSDETATHRWKLYVRGPRNEDLSSFIQKVAFTLHPSFPEPVREVKSPPFEVTETGWGEFEASMRLYFKDPSQSPVDLFHLIKLYPLGPPQPAGVVKKPAAVVAEQYDEVVFCETSEKFRRQLMSYSVREGNAAAGASEQAVLTSEGAGQGAGAGTVLDDSLDVERLGAIQQHINVEIAAAKARLLQLQASVVEATQQRVAQSSSRPSQAAAAEAGAGFSGSAPAASKARPAGGQLQAGATKAGAAGQKGAGDAAAKKPRPPAAKKAAGAQPAQQQQPAQSGMLAAEGSPPLPVLGDAPA